jgi:hypothetical protein
MLRVHLLPDLDCQDLAGREVDLIDSLYYYLLSRVKNKY